MSKLSNEKFQAHLEQICGLAEGPLKEIQKEVEVTNKFPREFYDLAIENDLYRCSLPEGYGGYGLNELEILQVQGEFSRGSGEMRMYLHYTMDLNWRTLKDYGNGEVKAECMPKFQNKEVFTCLVLTKTTGDTGADLCTIAVKDSDSYVLNGEKTSVSRTDCCELAYVIVVTNPESDKSDRLSTFFIPLDTPGFKVIDMPHMMGYRGAGHGELKFTDCRIDKKYLLGKEGQGLKIVMHSLSVSRAHVAAGSLGMAQRILELSLRYAADRVTFGRPIGTRRTVHCKIADISMMVHTLRCTVYDFAKSYMENPTDKYIEKRAAMCKLYSTDTTRRASDEILEIFGGVGHFEGCKCGPAERLYRSCRTMWLEKGASTVQRITISKSTIKHSAHVEYII